MCEITFKKIKMEFEQIQKLIDTDQLIAAERMLDDLIADASRQLASLKTKEMKLNKEYKTCQKKLTESQKTNQQLSKYESKFQDNYDENNQGTFFVQLRRVEADIERCKMNIEGITSVINNLKGEHSKSIALSGRLIAKLNDLREQYEIVKADETAKRTQLNQLNSKLDEVTIERDLLEEDVEDMKAKLNQLVEDLGEVTPIERDFLITQREVLGKELQEKLKILEDRQNEEKNLSAKSLYNQNKKNRRISSISSTSSWLNEREAMIGRIKNLRTALKNLETQQRGIEKTQSKNKEIMSDPNFNTEETKYALIAERLSVPTVINDFFLQALAIEKSRYEKLKSRLSQLSQVSNQVSEFTTKTAPFTKLDEEMIENTTRITLLRDELSELREKARK